MIDYNEVAEGIPGLVFAVSDIPSGTTIAATTGVGVTRVKLDDVYDFNPAGGQFKYAGTYFTYNLVDYLTNEVVLTTPSPVAFEVNLSLVLFPPTSTKWALVQADANSDSISVRIPHALADRFDTGVRVDTDRENVTIRVEGTSWVIHDVIGLAPVVTGTVIRTAADGARLQMRPGSSSIGYGNGIFEFWSGLDGEAAPGEIYTIVDGPLLTDNASLYLMSPRKVGYNGRALIQLYAEDPNNLSSANIGGQGVFVEATTSWLTLKAYAGVDMRATAGPLSLLASNTIDITAATGPVDLKATTNSARVTGRDYASLYSTLGAGGSSADLQVVSDPTLPSIQAYIGGTRRWYSSPTDTTFMHQVYVPNITRTGAYASWFILNMASSTWDHYGGGFEFIAFRRMADGMVKARGLARLGGVGAANPIFTFPVGYRPASVEVFTGTASGGVADLRVDTAGRVFVSGYVAGGTNAFVSLTNIHFDPA